MSARPPRPAHYALTPTPVDVGEPFSVGIAFYRTEHELTFYLRALQNGGGSRMVVVLALRAGAAVPPAELPDHARLIQTAAGGPVPDGRIGWFVPDPLQAVVMAMTGRQAGDGLLLLFPDDWPGDAPEALVDKARRWRSGPHSREDDEFFEATHPY